MSRGLGKVQRKILGIIEKSDLEDGEWVSIESILVQMGAPKSYPHSKAQSIWRALRRLERLGYVKTRKFKSDFRFRYTRLTDKRLVLVGDGAY